MLYLRMNPRCCTPVWCAVPGHPAKYIEHEDKISKKTSFIKKSVTSHRDPLTGPPFHWSPISALVPLSLVPQLIGPPIHYWNSLVPNLIGPQSHWSPIPLVPIFISHPIIGQSQYGPSSHWSPISLVPFSLVFPLIGPPISTHAPPIPLVPHLIAPPPPTHWSPISLVLPT